MGFLFILVAEFSIHTSPKKKPCVLIKFFGRPDHWKYFNKRLPKNDYTRDLRWQSPKMMQDPFFKKHRNIVSSSGFCSTTLGLNGKIYPVKDIGNTVLVQWAREVKKTKTAKLLKNRLLLFIWPKNWADQPFLSLFFAHFFHPQKPNTCYRSVQK